METMVGGGLQNGSRSSTSSVVASHYKSSVSALISNICLLSQDVRVKKRNCGELGRLLLLLDPIVKDVKWSDLIGDPHARICVDNFQKALKRAEDMLRRCASSGPFAWMLQSTRIARELADISSEISYCLHVVQMLVAKTSRKQLHNLRIELLDMKYKVHEDDWRLSEKLIARIIMKTPEATAHMPLKVPFKLPLPSSTLSPSPLPMRKEKKKNGSRSASPLVDHSDLPYGTAGLDGELDWLLHEAADHLGIPTRDIIREFNEVKEDLSALGMLQVMEIDPNYLELFRVIGSGGGRSNGVWAAKLWEKGGDGQISSYRNVAVKRFPMLEGIHITEEFKREVEVFQKASNRCQNVCKLYGICEKDGHLCIVMELYKQSLQDIIQKAGGPMSLLDVERYAVDMCKAVMQLHREHIIVQDIKPANFLEDADGNLVIADFGISRIVERTNCTYHPTLIRGTSRFMSPEAWTGDGLWAQSDIWSLGCTFLNMITGEVPWGGIRDTMIIYKVLHQQEKPEVPDGLPVSLRQLLLQCFEYHPFDRPQAHEMLAFFLCGFSGNVVAKFQVALTDVFIVRANVMPTGPVTAHAYVADHMGTKSGDRLIKLTDIQKQSSMEPWTSRKPEVSGDHVKEYSDLFSVNSEKQIVTSLRHPKLVETSESEHQKVQGLKIQGKESKDAKGGFLKLNGVSFVRVPTHSFCCWASIIGCFLIVLAVSISVPIAILLTLRQRLPSYPPYPYNLVPSNLSRDVIEAGGAWQDIGGDNEERSHNLAVALGRLRNSMPGIPCLGSAFDSRRPKRDSLFRYMCTYLGGPLDMEKCQYKYPNTTEIVTNDYRMAESVLLTHGPNSNRYFSAGQQDMFVQSVVNALKSVAPVGQSTVDRLRQRLLQLSPVIVQSLDPCPADVAGPKLLWRRNVAYNTTIRVGQIVTWDWDDDFLHSIEDMNKNFPPSFDGTGTGDHVLSRRNACTIESAKLAEAAHIPCTFTPGKFTYSQKFDAPGTYSYVCSQFPGDMSGTVTVLP